MRATPQRFGQSWVYHAPLRATASAAVGLLAGWLLTMAARPEFAALWGWDVATVVYVGWIVIATFHLDSSRTRLLAASEDPGPATIDMVVVLCSLASLAGFGITLVRAGDAYKTLAILTCAVSVFLSWAVLHCTFALSYARLYYNDLEGGIDFHSSLPPRYLDFAYVAFTIGMTFQVSDTDVTSTAIRATALRQALLSYIFGAVIIATVVGLFANLAK